MSKRSPAACRQLFDGLRVPKFTLRLSNPFRWGAERPSLKERAATLRATAGRVTSGAQPDPKAVPDVPDAPAYDAAAKSGGPVGNLHASEREFDAAPATWRKAVEANREPSARYTAAIEAAHARGGPTMQTSEPPLIEGCCAAADRGAFAEGF